MVLLPTSLLPFLAMALLATALIHATIRARRGAMLVLLLILSGCWRSAPGPLSLEGYRAVYEPEQTTVSLLLKEKAQKVRALRALYRTTLRKSIERQQFKQIIVFERPDRFRSELLATNFNQPTNLVVTEGSHLQGIDFPEKRFFDGGATLQNLQKLLTVPFLPEELMLWLIGAVQPVNGSDLIGTKYFLERGSDKFAGEFTYRPDRVIQIRGTIRAKERYLQLDGLTVFDRKSRKETFSSTYEYDEASATPTLPSRIQFWVPEREIQGELVADGLSVNPAPETLSDRLFQLSPTKSLRLIELDE